MKKKPMVIESDPESSLVNATVNRSRLDSPPSSDDVDVLFWRRYLAGMGSGTFLPFNAAGPQHAGSGDYHENLFILDSEGAGKLLMVSHRLSISAGIICMGVWSYLLHRYTGEKNIFFGVRAASDILPFKAVIESGSAIGSWLQEIGAVYAQVRQHGRPPGEVVQHSGVNGRLFDTVMALGAAVIGPGGEDGSLILG